MDCSDCSSTLEVYSVEYRWNGSAMEPRTWYYCGRCHQIWIMNGEESEREMPLTAFNR
jgi:hypothetical protein